MSFQAKTDVFGIADSSLVILETQGGETATNVEATGADGSVVANEVAGEVAAPSCTLQLKADVSKAAGAWKLGGVSVSDGKSFAMGEVRISTSGGGIPSISVSGVQVEDGAAEGCYYKVPEFSLSKAHHAQILFGAFTLSGTGCHLTAADYVIGCDVNVATVNALPVAFDVARGRIEAVVSIKQCGSVKPTLTAGDGWSVTSPLSSSNPDAEYPTYSATLTKYLAKSHAA